MDKKSCYNCQHFSLCRVRDRASHFVGYENNTGNLLSSEFHPSLYELMASLCYEYKQEETNE